MKGVIQNYEEKINEKIGYIKDISATYRIEKEKIREYGVHLTSSEIFKKYIFPEIQNCLYNYAFVDLFCGEGNLILPILEFIPEEKRESYFKDHIYLFDIQKEMVEKSIKKAIKYGILENIARENIRVQDTLKNYPIFIKNLKYPVYHITNPPYLYIGYIAKKSERNLEYFSGENSGFQDLYQIALMNDLRNGIKKLIYIIPTNFLFGFSSANKIRMDFLPFYEIKKATIFERKIFEFTGTNVCICFFERVEKVNKKNITFQAIKINKNSFIKKKYSLSPENFYRAGSEFDEFVSLYSKKGVFNIKFYLTLDEVIKNKGENSVKLLDVNSFSDGYYKFQTYMVNQNLYKTIKDNPLFIRTLDTGKWEGRAGIYNIKEVFGVEGILVTKEKYRTHPIQVFITPSLDEDDLELLKNYFNLILEYFRDITDSEFLTTFKYSNSEYVRKYLGLSQTKKLIETFPISLMSDKEKQVLKILIQQKNVEDIKDILNNLEKESNNLF